MLPTLSNNEVFGPNIASAVNAVDASKFARCCVTVLPGAYAGSGTGHLVASAVGAIAAQNGVTPAAGDMVLLLAGATHIAAAKDAGLYVVTNPGAAGAEYVLDRPAGWAHGATIQIGASIRVGGEDTLFGGCLFKAFCTAGKVVDTDDPLLYPDRVAQSVTLSSGTHTAITNVPIRSGGQVLVFLDPTYGVTPDTATFCYQTGLVTPGAIGTASFAPLAMTKPGGSTNTNDASVVWCLVLN
jgi:hypothetical protein